MKAGGLTGSRGSRYGSRRVVNSGPESGGQRLRERPSWFGGLPTSQVAMFHALRKLSGTSRAGTPAQEPEHLNMRLRPGP
jgi:hypothetical protein